MLAPLPSTSQTTLPDVKQQPSLSLTSTVQRPEPDPTPSPPAVPEEENHRENRQIKMMRITSQGK